MDSRAARTFEVNGVIVDIAGGVVRDREGREIALRPQAFDLLKYLLENADRLVTALRMAPNQFEILTFYAFLASTFGEPQRGGEMVDQAIRLNPNYPVWSTRIFAAAYFMAGRYEDALRMQAQMGPENYGRRMWVYRPAALAATGRTAEAKTALAQALKWFPDLTIEGFVSLPDTNENDRRRLVETMRLAGFPPCAKPEALAGFVKPFRLPECVER